VRIPPSLPTRPGQAMRVEHEYARGGAHALTRRRNPPSEAGGLNNTCVNFRSGLPRDGLHDWLARGHGAGLAVPSAVVPAERSYLLNPNHPDFAHIIIGAPEALGTDRRLMRAP
jgi:hypothetical protein